MKDKHILLIDDSPTIRVKFKDLLEAIGATVVVAESAERGMELCRSATPDCILLDYQLPNMSGLEFLDWLQSENHHTLIPVVMLSGEGDEAIAVEAMKRGALDYMVKNVATVQAVRHALSNAMEKGALHKKLAEKNQEMEEFVFTAAHDLKAPLANLKQFAGFLLEDLADNQLDSIEKNTHIIADSSQQMMQLLNDLLEYTRVGRSDTPFGTVDLQVIAERAIDNLRVFIEEAQAQMVVDSLPRIQGDQTALLQLFQNLIANAIKFRGHRTPVVTINARLEGGTWQINVDDNGIGIDQKDNSKIFSPLKRLYGHSQFEGSGIGLAICKKVVAQHGGHIWVESVVGIGTSFRFTVPNAKASEKTSRPTQAPDSSTFRDKAATRTLRVLYVEDDEDWRHVFSLTAKEAGFDASYAENGDLAIKQFLQAETDGCPIDIILADMQMPVLNGLETVQKLRDMNCQVPVIAYTASASQFDRETCLAAGCNEHITKPATTQELSAILTRVSKSVETEPVLAAGNA